MVGVVVGVGVVNKWKEAILTLVIIILVVTMIWVAIAIGAIIKQEPECQRMTDWDDREFTLCEG